MMSPLGLHGAMYDAHGEDWAITRAGIEYRPSGQVVVAEHEFPESGQSRPPWTGTDQDEWSPAARDGADPAEWHHVLRRGHWHFPVRRGPVVEQRTWWPSQAVPEAAAESQ
jgi:hypothetical protein